jgi:hypothetical protein
MDFTDAGRSIFDALKRHDALPAFARSQGKYGTSRADEGRYQQYLQFGVLQELAGTGRRNHLNLDDAGLLLITYDGLRAFAADRDVWRTIPALDALLPTRRTDYLHGFLDIVRRSRAITHSDLINDEAFDLNVLDKLNPSVFFHQGGYGGTGAVGFSDTAASSRDATVYRWNSPAGTLAGWTRRVLGVAPPTAAGVITSVVDAMRHPDAGFFVDVHRKEFGTLTMLNPERLRFQVSGALRHLACPKCGLVHHFHELRVCTGRQCGALREQGFEQNYFRCEYVRPLDGDVRVVAEEHSGQVSGQDRRQIEERFRDVGNPLNTLVCTPTLELGIDIGQLTSVYMRNVPPSPSNHAQRAGRAGRKGQPSLITVFCGAGFARGRHDQYFYKHPDKIIAGAIAAPRFLLDNRTLLRTHIHSLILETLGRERKLPTRPREMLDLEAAGQPLYADLADAYRNDIARRSEEIYRAVCDAFAQERATFAWMTEEFIRGAISAFVDALDCAFDTWRSEFRRLKAEFDEISTVLRDMGPSAELKRRSEVVSERLADMREGRHGFYVYRYLGAQGFLPNYAFPRQATTTTFYEIDNEISREQGLALREYAPGNSIYYRGNRYEVTRARARTEQGTPAFDDLLVCPACSAAYLGKDAKRPACMACGTALTGTHVNHRALRMPDMLAKRRTSITADEEERTRLGYAISYHYQPGHLLQRFHLVASAQDPDRAAHSIELTYEHNGRVIQVNEGTIQAQRNDQEEGFVLCRRCSRWLLSEDAVRKHLDPQSSSACRHGATEEDILRRVMLFSDAQVDVVTLDLAVPEGTAPGQEEMFYTTLATALLYATDIALDLDESELNGFLMPHPTERQRWRIVLYEVAEGGMGAVQTLTDAARLAQIAERACEILHEREDAEAKAGGDPTMGGCEQACYDCLCSFYNQRNHHLLNRHLVLPIVRQLCTPQLSRAPGPASCGASLDELLARCQTQLEQTVLRELSGRGLPLPDDVQHLCTDSAGAPLARADFFYAQPGSVVVFIDGPDHDQDYVRSGDSGHRRRLKDAGYSVIAIRYDAIEQGLERLARRLGVTVTQAGRIG